MALTSPGVQVTVIDESFYTPAEPGTTPLIVVATAQNKSNAAGTATAAGTTQANAGVAFKITSQKELVDTFGVPFFEKTASGSPIHGSERNEYGLLAAYSYLGASNSAFIVRANVDLDQLEPQSAAPGAEPTDGQWWLDTQTSEWGIQEWNAAEATVGGQKFVTKTPVVLSDDDTAKLDTGVPMGSVGSIGDYAVVALSTQPITVYYKSPGNLAATVDAGEWVVVGSDKWKSSVPTITTSSFGTGGYTGTLNLNGVSVGTYTNGTAAEVAADINSLPASLNITAKASGTGTSKILYIFSNDAADDNDSTLNGAITVTGDALPGTEAKTYLQPELVMGPHTSVPVFKKRDFGTDVANGRPTGSVWIKTTEPGNGARVRVKRYSSATKAWAVYSAPMYANGQSAIYTLDRTGGGKNIAVDSIYIQHNSDEYTNVSGATVDTAKLVVYRRANAGNTVITSTEVTASTFTAGAKSFTVVESLQGETALSDAVTVEFTTDGSADDAVIIATAINAAGLVNVEAAVTATNELQIFHKLGGEFRLTEGTGTPLDNLFTAGVTANFYAAAAGAAEDYVASNWKPLTNSFAASGDAPLNEPEDGQLWFNNNYSDVDIMVHNGTTWKGYRQVYASTSSEGPVVSASTPDSAYEVDQQLWISTEDMENFPIIRRWSADLQEWVLVDKTDQITEEGILFADARWTTGPGLSTESSTESSIKELLLSDFLDFDAPDPALYPKGMLLWNLRRSGGNVKRYANNYVNTAADNPRMGDESMESYFTDRWVTASPNAEDGSGSFGRKAQRAVVVAALKSTVDTSEQIRDEERRNFNLIAAPGYTEVYSNLVNLNIDRGLTAFVIGDTPLRLKGNATELINWGTNARAVTDNGDAGVVTYDEYSALWYPSGYTTDLSGIGAVVPSSHMMLKTIALSDQVSYPWFAPAGTRRGGITNATSVGYIDSLSGEFQTVFLNEGMRDVLYDLKINPIPYFVGVGHVAFGQKTRARNASALDRINVARLVCYLRSQLNKLARPYLFEPNDKITRDEIKGAVESLLLELVGLRAIYDFAVQCDEQNNTPARVDRNELYVDIAIEPVKAVEFIYIPLRVKNTGEI